MTKKMYLVTAHVYFHSYGDYVALVGIYDTRDLAEEGIKNAISDLRKAEDISYKQKDEEYLRRRFKVHEIDAGKTYGLTELYDYGDDEHEIMVEPEVLLGGHVE